MGGPYNNIRQGPLHQHCHKPASLAWPRDTGLCRPFDIGCTITLSTLSTTDTPVSDSLPLSFPMWRSDITFVITQLRIHVRNMLLIILLCVWLMLHSGHESLQQIPTYVAKSYWTCLAEMLVLIISPSIEARCYHGVISNE